MFGDENMYILAEAPAKKQVGFGYKFYVLGADTYKTVLNDPGLKAELKKEGWLKLLEGRNITEIDAEELKGKGGKKLKAGEPVPESLIMGQIAKQQQKAAGEHRKQKSQGGQLGMGAPLQR